MSLADTRERFETASAQLLDDARHAPADYLDGMTAEKTIALAIGETANCHPFVFRRCILT